MYSIEAEYGVISSLLDFKRSEFEEASNKLREEHFSDRTNQAVYVVMLKLFEARGSFTIASVMDYCSSTGIKGVNKEYIQTIERFRSPSCIHYVKSVVRLYEKRKLYDILMAAAERCKEQDADKVVDSLDADLKDFRDSQQEVGYSDFSTVVDRLMAMVEQRRKNPFYDSMRSNFNRLDDMIGGFRGGQMVVIAARAGIGKTAFATTLVERMCLKNDIPMGFISLEMPDFQIASRVLSTHMQISGSKFLRSEFLTLSELGAINDLSEKKKDIKLYINDNSSMSMLDIKREARRMKKNHDIKALVIDYIGLIKTEDSRIPRWERMQQISHDIKTLARELDITIFALNQVNRDAEGKEPTLANLRESGAVEQDADIVLLLHRDRRPKSDPNLIETKIKVEKNRNGEVGDVIVDFVPKYACFREQEFKNYEETSEEEYF